MPTYILGINSAYHESAACLLRDGVILAAAEEERFNRNKHGKPARVDNPDRLPEAAISYCLSMAGISMRDVDYVGYSLTPDLRRRNSRYREPVVEGGWGSDAGEEEFYRRVLSVPTTLGAAGFQGTFEWIKHHRCHAASAFYVSPFEEAAILTIDGIGELATTYMGLGRQHRIDDLMEVEYPHSLGFLWEKLSKFLGFSEYDACKVMGLAAFGDPGTFARKFDLLYALLPEGKFSLRGGVLHFRAEDDSGLSELLGLRPRRPGDDLGQEHADLAAALQACTNRVVVHLARALHRRTAATDLCLAGGVALNCVTNLRLLLDTPFRRVFVQAAAHDAGTALGAAFVIWNEHLRGPKRDHPSLAYLGPEYDSVAIRVALEKAGCAYRLCDRIEREVAGLLAEGKIVAHFRGRMEWGPRALGNRSLLADPRRKDMKAILNLKVKHREPFRPFAPSVLTEEAGAWFEIPDGALGAEYMLVTCKARESRAARIPAVVHVDGTSRVQIVKREQNPPFHAIISEFQALTDVPVVLNTSFNDDEPIVCAPEDAISTFQKTAIDFLAIGPYLVGRP